VPIVPKCSCFEKAKKASTIDCGRVCLPYFTSLIFVDKMFTVAGRQSKDRHIIHTFFALISAVILRFPSV